MRLSQADTVQDLEICHWTCQLSNETMILYLLNPTIFFPHHILVRIDRQVAFIFVIWEKEYLFWHRTIFQEVHWEICHQG